MAHLALYREWRPRIFDDIVEQKHAVHALRQSVVSGQIAHAYLFSGTRGTGKTTMAKIFSRAINCLQPDAGNPCNSCEICLGILNGSLLDVLEMDAASNNSVDNIRRICDEVVFMPSQARYKVYIIDEVHMLSTGAFNALLKTLEEPPAHAVFILATTEPHRIPATILSRCQRYDFRRLPVASMAQRLRVIAATDNINIDDEAIETVAMLADGALRDAISLLDQARTSFSDRTIGRDEILALAGVVHDAFMVRMSESILTGDTSSLLELVEQLVMDGRDLPRFVTDLAQHFRNMLICRVADNPQSLVRVSRQSFADMTRLAANTDTQTLIDLIQGLSALLSDLRWAADARTALEIGLIRLTGSKAPVRQAKAAEEAADNSNNPNSHIIDDTMAEPDDNDVPVDPQDTAKQIPEADGLDDSKAASAAEIWNAASQHLQDNGQMTLYLFSRPASPGINDGVLELRFSAADKLNYAEIAQEGNLRLLGESIQAATGQNLKVRAQLENTGRQAVSSGGKKDDWIGKVINAAEELGIPVELEE